MSDTLAQIDDFRRFAEKRVAAGDRRTVGELFEEWVEEAQPIGDEESDLRAIEEALEDLDAGHRGRPLEEFDREFRRRNGLS